MAKADSSFMFHLTRGKMEKWKAQIVTSNLLPEDEAELRIGLYGQSYLDHFYSVVPKKNTLSIPSIMGRI